MIHPVPPPNPEEFEQTLLAELQPVQPSPGFADAVMSRVAQEQVHAASPVRSNPKLRLMPSRNRWSWPALAAALLLLALPSIYGFRELRVRRQAAVTQARFDLAMRLTSRTLAHVDQQIDGTLNRAGDRVVTLPH